MSKGGKDFSEVVKRICIEDTRYSRPSYFFVKQALDYTLKCRMEKGIPPGHISGQELLQGIADFGLEQFGTMAFAVLKEWGVTRCEDFGEIVFNLVDFGVFGKTEEDCRSDFANGYDFYETFQKPFLPQSKQDIKR